MQFRLGGVIVVTSETTAHILFVKWINVWIETTTNTHYNNTLLHAGIMYSFYGVFMGIGRIP